MEYVITLKKKGENEKVIGRYENKEEAMSAGKLAYENSNRGDMVSCISGKINDDGKIEGVYRLYQTWY